MFFKIITWIATTISIVGFAMYLLDKADWMKFKTLKPWILISIVAGCTIISIVFALLDGKQKFSRREIQSAATILGDISIKLQVYHNELVNLKLTKEKLYDSKKKVLSSTPTELLEIRKEFSNYLMFKLSKLDSISLNRKPSVENFRIISKTNIPLEDIDVLYSTVYPESIMEIKEFYQELDSSEMLLLTTDWLDRAIELKFEMLQTWGRVFYFNVLELVAEMPQKVKEDFYSNLVPFLTDFPEVKFLSKQEAKSLADRAYNQFADLVVKYAAIVGSEELNIKLMELEVSRIQKKVELRNTLNEDLQVKKMELKQAQESLRQKCKLQKGEDKVLMWSKIMRLATARMYDDAIASLGEYLEFNNDTDPNALVYVKSTKAYYSILSDLKKENKKAPVISGISIDTIGVVVALYENNQPHSCIEIGDIILFSKKEPVRNFESYVSIAKQTGEKQLIIYRLDHNEKLIFMELVAKETDPRIGMFNLFE